MEKFNVCCEQNTKHKKQNKTQHKTQNMQQAGTTSPVESNANAGLKIYFCGSIRGEAVDKQLLRSLIQHLQSYGKVLTEQLRLMAWLWEWE